MNFRGYNVLDPVPLSGIPEELTVVWTDVETNNFTTALYRFAMKYVAARGLGRYHHTSNLWLEVEVYLFRSGRQRKAFP